MTKAEGQAQVVVASRAAVEPLAAFHQRLVELDGGWVKRGDPPAGREGQVGVAPPGESPRAEDGAH